MIDIHAHILPGFDDGAGTMAEAVEMARQASANGIATVVATPHILDPLRPHRDKILSTVTDLRAALRAAGIAVEILPGAEIHIEPEVARAVRDGAAMTIGDAGRHLLLELP
ncbi:MAG: CpsB/CapC family capsule biosynthesis tyrosine phosphatase, partial [Bacteroidota bacterium]